VALRIRVDDRRVNNSGRRRIRWVAGAIVVLVVLGVGGPFVFFHFIEGKAPAPLTLSTTAPAPTTPTTATAGSTASPAAGSTSGSAGSADGTWKVATGSTAGYRVKETLLGQSNTAVGRTTALTGSLTISGVDVAAGSFSADLTQVKSDQSVRDSQFQGRIMDTSKYPTATFVLTKPIELGTLPADGATIMASATGNLTIHGAAKSVTFQVQARKNGTTIQVSGAIPVTFSDFNIDNPSGGPASVGNSGTLEFLLDLSRV
jgi:polyisoprenoid-binding protein YceI